MNKKRGSAENDLSTLPRALCAELCLIMRLLHLKKTQYSDAPSFALFLAPRPVFAVLSHTALFKSEKYFSYYSK